MATIVCHLLLVHNHVVEIIHILIGKDFRVGLLLITYLVVEYVSFGIYLPISATMAIIALPLMAMIFVKGDQPAT